MNATEKKKFRFSILTLVLCSLLIAMAFIAIYERNRANQLRKKLEEIRSTKLAAINQQNWTIQKRRLAYDYAVDQLDETWSSQSLDSNQFPTLVDLPVGQRRQLANLRNAKLKIDRDLSVLDEMKSELEKIDRLLDIAN